MKTTQSLNQMGQSLWLDHVTRGLLQSGTLSRYIDELTVTGLTSNPSLFGRAIRASRDYDDIIRRLTHRGRRGEDLFFDLALEDLGWAADLLRPIFERTKGADGWVSLEVSPLLAHDSRAMLEAARDLNARAARPNVFLKIPGTQEGLAAVEEAIFEGIPVNVTLLFSTEQYLAAAEAYLRGTERRIRAGLPANVESVASVFISRWDVAVAGIAPEALRNQLGIAIAGRTYEAYRLLVDSARWRGVMRAGARGQRLLWASTGTKDPHAPDTFYVSALAAPFTVNTMPEDTLKAFADHGKIGQTLPMRGSECETVLARFKEAGISVEALAVQLRDDGERTLDRSWSDLLTCLSVKSRALDQPQPVARRAADAGR